MEESLIEWLLTRQCQCVVVVVVVGLGLDVVVVVAALAIYQCYVCVVEHRVIIVAFL